MGLRSWWNRRKYERRNDHMADTDTFELGQRVVVMTGPRQYMNGVVVHHYPPPADHLYRVEFLDGKQMAVEGQNLRTLPSTDAATVPTSGGVALTDKTIEREAKRDEGYDMSRERERVREYQQKAEQQRLEGDLLEELRQTREDVQFLVEEEAVQKRATDIISAGAPLPHECHLDSCDRAMYGVVVGLAYVPDWNDVFPEVWEDDFLVMRTGLCKQHFEEHEDYVRQMREERRKEDLR